MVSAQSDGGGRLDLEIQYSILFSTHLQAHFVVDTYKPHLAMRAQVWDVILSAQLPGQAPFNL